MPGVMKKKLRMEKVDLRDDRNEMEHEKYEDKQAWYDPLSHDSL
jgi:hypothetical protein